MTVGQGLQARLAAQGSPTARTVNACIALGHPEGIAGMFVREFDESRSHRYDWGTISDAELQTLVADFLDNGYITMKKPLVFSSDVPNAAAIPHKAPTMSIHQRVSNACRNPNVPDHLITKFIEHFGASLSVYDRTWDSVDDSQIATHLDTFLRTGRI